MNNKDDKNRRDEGVLKNSFIISGVVLSGKVLGFVKQAVIAWAFGANAITDIYFAADGYTSMFGQIMGTSVAPTVLTRYVKLSEENKKEKAKALIQESFLFFSILGIVLVLINVLLSKEICNVIGISYTGEQKIELRFFLIALCPVMLFTSLTGVAQGYMDANKHFVPAKLCSLFFSVSIIIFVICFKDVLGLRALLYGFLLGYALHTVYMLSIVLPKTGIVISNPFADEEFKKMLKRFAPLVIGNSVVDLGHLVDKIVASSLVAGSVSALYYGQVISSDIVNAVIVTSVGTVLLTSLTSLVSAKADNAFIKGRIQFIICAMTFFTALVTALYIVEGMDLIKLFFERGSFDSSNTRIVASVASFYAVGFIFMANREILIKAHYAFQDTMTPMINSVIGVAVNLIGSIVLSRFLGVAGVALATSISMIVVSVISTFTLKKHLGSVPITKETIKDLCKICVAMILATIIGKGLFSLMIDTHFLIRMMMVSLAMIIIYIIIVMLSKEIVISQFANNRVRNTK